MKKYLNLILLLFPVLSCVKDKTLTENDFKFLLTSQDLQINNADFIEKPLKNGDKYFFSRELNNFGLYSLYSYTIVEKISNKEVKIQCSADKFYKEHNAKKLFDSKSILLKIYKDEIEVIDLERFNSDNGFYIRSSNYINLTLKKENILFSIVIEGDYQLNLKDIENLIIEKMDYLYNTDIETLIPG